MWSHVDVDASGVPCDRYVPMGELAWALTSLCKVT